ncbi:Receptor-like protein 2 [Morella rubra]|uniref:Receptor-like protein 2 n=1 Tax=Morella rubra TaxID=262757 RepID=A0A6A1VNS2_9ROSI|nr:Receptor-like protein 2 [Morella rubra]
MDRNSLFSLPFNTSCPPLNWSSTNCCNWEGIACDPRGYVTHISYPLKASEGGLPASIQVLDMSSNFFNGTIQSSFLQRAWNLSKLNLSNNTFTGNITALNFSSLQQLTTLDMGFNDFIGNFLYEAIPTDDKIAHSDGFKNVRLLDLTDCQLTGPLPMWLSNLKKLEMLDLGLNKISGSIPGWFSTLPRLKQLDLSDNLISGEIPKELCSLPALISAESLENESSLLLPLFKMRNHSILQDWSFKVARALVLNGNNFSGNIPDQISELTNLETLYLSDNQLSGEIPASLVSLNFLSEFEVANNNLYGPIPAGTQLQSFGAAAYEGNPGLCGAPLPNKCSHTNTVESNVDKDNQDHEKPGHDRIPWFPITVVLGFITGFWGVCGSLVLNRNWRNAYFRFLENLGDWLYVTLAVSWARLRRKLQ